MFICSPWFANDLIIFSKTGIFIIITCRINQLRPVAKRDNLYTLSLLFALKLCLFRLKCILKLRKHTFEKVFSTPCWTSQSTTYRWFLPWMSLLSSDGESELNGKKSVISIKRDYSDNDVDIESEELVIGKPIMTGSGGQVKVWTRFDV